MLQRDDLNLGKLSADDVQHFVIKQFSLLRKVVSQIRYVAKNPLIHKHQANGFRSLQIPEQKLVRPTGVAEDTG